MGRPSYVCATCSEYFTRKYSARRHNQNIHNGAAEIVRLIDYLAGRSSGQYTANNPFWYKRSNPNDNIRSADSVGTSFQPRYISQTPLAGSRYTSENHVIADTTSSFRSETLKQHYPLPYSQHPTIQQKLDELKILAEKFSIPEDARKILGWANIRLRQGDESFLDNKLEQLRYLANVKF